MMETSKVERSDKNGNRSYDLSPIHDSRAGFRRPSSRSPELNGRDSNSSYRRSPSPRYRSPSPSRYYRYRSPDTRRGRSPPYDRYAREGSSSSRRYNRYERRGRSPSDGPSYRERSRSRSYDAHYSRPRTSRLISPTPPSPVLAVFNLPRRDVYNLLWDMISRYVPILRLSLITDKRTGMYRGYAFITFSTVEDATKAKEVLHGQVVEGRTVRADFSNTPEPHQSTPGRYMGRRSPNRYPHRDPPYRRH